MNPPGLRTFADELADIRQRIDDIGWSAPDGLALQQAGFHATPSGNRYVRNPGGPALAWSEWVDLAEHILDTNDRLGGDTRVGVAPPTSRVLAALTGASVITAPSGPWVLVVHGCDPDNQPDVVSDLFRLFPENPPLVSFMPMSGGAIHHTEVEGARCSDCQERIHGDRLDDVIRASLAHDTICDHVF